jgi:hypothetical protein
MNVRIVFGSIGLLCAIVLVAPSARGAVFERNWKAAGDGLLTYDDVNQREWLDLPLTLASSGVFPDGVFTEMHPGGLLDGFSWAKGADVIALAESAGVNTTTLDFVANHNATNNVIGLLGITRGPNLEDDIYAGGRIDATGSPSGLSVGAFFQDEISDARAGLSLSSQIDIVGRLAPGVWIFREAVPEPPTVHSSAIALLFAFMGIRRR